MADNHRFLEATVTVASFYVLKFALNILILYNLFLGYFPEITIFIHGGV
jgi:hypothetical protein